MSMTRENETSKEQTLESRWLPWVSRGILIRSAIVGVVLGSILTLVNQPGWIDGSEPLQLLPLILVFTTPFAVVLVSQVVGVRRAYIDSVDRGVPARAEGFLTTVVSHGIPVRALAIGLVFGSLNALLSLADEFLRSGDLAAVSVAPLGQAYVLPLLFAVLSQTISYRRSRN